MKAVAETLGVSRFNLAERLKGNGRPRRRYRKAGDAVLLARLRRLIDKRPTYGYRRMTALLNRELAAEGGALFRRPSSLDYAALARHHGIALSSGS